MPKAVTEAQTRPGKVRKSQFSSREGKSKEKKHRECLHSTPGHTRLFQAQIWHLNVFSFVTEDTGRVKGKLP